MPNLQNLGKLMTNLIRSDLIKPSTPLVGFVTSFFLFSRNKKKTKWTLTVTSPYISHKRGQQLHITGHQLWALIWQRDAILFLLILPEACDTACCSDGNNKNLSVSKVLFHARHGLARKNRERGEKKWYRRELTKEVALAYASHTHTF